MSHTSVLEHRANYHYTQTREDFLEICCQGECSPHCKALILSILESWTNTKRDKSESDFVYMSLSQWVKYTYMWYERNTICDCLIELMAEGMITRRPITMYDQETFEYHLEVEVVQALLRALPDKSKYDVLPNLNAYLAYKERKKAKRVREKSHTLENREAGVCENSQGVCENSQGVCENSQGGYVNNQHNLSSLTNLPLTFTKIEDIVDAAGADINAPSALSEQNENEEQQTLFPEEKTPVPEIPIVVAPSSKKPKKAKRVPKSSSETPPTDPRQSTWQKRINEWRGAPLPTKGGCINETVSLKKLLAEYTDAQLDAILRAMLVKWPYKDDPRSIGAREIWKEAGPTSGTLKDLNSWPDETVQLENPVEVSLKTAKVLDFPGSGKNSTQKGKRVQWSEAFDEETFEGEFYPTADEKAERRRQRELAAL